MELTDSDLFWNLLLLLGIAPLIIFVIREKWKDWRESHRKPTPEQSERQQWDRDDETEYSSETLEQRRLLRRELEQKELALRYLLGSQARGQLSDKEVSGISEIEGRILKIKDALTRRTNRAANSKSGYVYIISNPAFRSDIVKIGMTCGVDPTDRIKGLYNTSTPLHFEIQMIHYSEDARTSERRLHEIFSSNRVNPGREFFCATPDEIRLKLHKLPGSIVYYNPKALAK